jgi:hypothetical protein
VLKQLQAVLKKCPSGMLHDSLTQMEKKLLAISGISGPEEVDIVYSSVSAVRPGEESFSGMMNGFNYLMILMQGSDALPTTQQITAVKEQERIYATLLRRWDHISTVEASFLNTLLEQNGNSKIIF